MLIIKSRDRLFLRNKVTFFKANKVGVSTFCDDILVPVSRKELSWLISQTSCHCHWEAVIPSYSTKRVSLQCNSRVQIESHRRQWKIKDIKGKTIATFLCDFPTRVCCCVKIVYAWHVYVTSKNSRLVSLFLWNNRHIVLWFDTFLFESGRAKHIYIIIAVIEIQSIISFFQLPWPRMSVLKFHGKLLLSLLCLSLSKKPVTVLEGEVFLKKSPLPWPSFQIHFMSCKKELLNKQPPAVILILEAHSCFREHSWWQSFCKDLTLILSEKSVHQVLNKSEIDETRVSNSSWCVSLLQRRLKSTAAQLIRKSLFQVHFNGIFIADFAYILDEKEAKRPQPNLIFKDFDKKSVRRQDSQLFQRLKAAWLTLVKERKRRKTKGKLLRDDKTRKRLYRNPVHEGSYHDYTTFYSRLASYSSISWALSK